MIKPLEPKRGYSVQSKSERVALIKTLDKYCTPGAACDFCSIAVHMGLPDGKSSGLFIFLFSYDSREDLDADQFEVAKEFIPSIMRENGHCITYDDIYSVSCIIPGRDDTNSLMMDKYNYALRFNVGYDYDAVGYLWGEENRQQEERWYNAFLNQKPIYVKGEMRI